MLLATGSPDDGQKLHLVERLHHAAHPHPRPEDEELRSLDMGETQLRLDIWRPARREMRLLYEQHGDGDPCYAELLKGRLHEQAYGWKMHGDVWTSIRDPEKLREITQALIVDFGSNLPPEQRSIAKLRDVVEMIGRLSIDKENQEWQDWEQPLGEDEKAGVYRTQPLLMLFHHLRWLCDIFKDLPGASVTVR